MFLIGKFEHWNIKHLKIRVQKLFVKVNFFPLIFDAYSISNNTPVRACESDEIHDQEQYFFPIFGYVMCAQYNFLNN